jgi:uncharacterized protein YbjT (DUF2867 family)
MDDSAANRVLIIGAQGVLGTLLTRGFREAGWDVVRGGRRPERAADFRLVDLSQPETLARALAEVDLVVSAVRDTRLTAERSVLSQGGMLINVNGVSAAERTALRREIVAPRGLVVGRTGLGGVVTFLAGRELIDQHADADTAEVGLTVSSRAASGREGRLFLHSLLARPSHHATARIALPPPFGRQRCIELGPNEVTETIFAEAFPGCAVHYYACLSPTIFRATFLGLNSVRLLSKLPRAAFTAGRGVPKRIPREPFCYWATLRRDGRVLGSRFLQGEGNYQGTVAATLVFAEALRPHASGPDARRGVLGVDEILALRDVEAGLAEHGVAVSRITPAPR